MSSRHDRHILGLWLWVLTKPIFWLNAALATHHTTTTTPTHNEEDM